MIKLVACTQTVLINELILSWRIEFLRKIAPKRSHHPDVNALVHANKIRADYVPICEHSQKLFF